MFDSRTLAQKCITGKFRRHKITSPTLLCPALASCVACLHCRTHQLDENCRSVYSPLSELLSERCKYQSFNLESRMMKNKSLTGMMNRGVSYRPLWFNSSLTLQETLKHADQHEDTENARRRSPLCRPVTVSAYQT